MRLILCGGRHFDDAALIERQLDQVHAQYNITVLIHGGLPAIGTPAEVWARRHTVHVVRYPANWQLLGKQADDIRNRFMLEDARPDFLLALPGGRHTHSLVQIAQQMNIGIIHADEDPHHKTASMGEEFPDIDGRRFLSHSRAGYPCAGGDRSTAVVRMSR